MGVAAAQGVQPVLRGAGARADRGAAELAGQDEPCLARLGRGHQVADIVLVDVATQHHGVARGLLRQGVQQACTCGRVAVPAVGGQLARRVVARREQGLLRQHAPARGMLASILGQALLQPGLLLPAEKAALGGCQLAAGARVHGAGRPAAGRAAGLPVAVLARIQHVQSGEPPPGQAPVELQTLKAAGYQGRCAQRHMLVIGLPGGGAQRWPAGVTQAVVAGVVVLHLMVVPGHHPGRAGMGGLQVGIALVEGVARAVVGQVLRQRQVVHARQAAGVFGAGVLVDVVTQEQHQIRLVGAGVAPGGVVTVLPALA